MKTLSFLFVMLIASSVLAAETPKVGDKAIDAVLKTIDGRAVQLSKAVGQAPVVLVVLRGFPGYTCPLCTKQVQDYLANADKLKQAGARVLLVYPGPLAQAKSFLSDKKLPAHYSLLVDPAPYPFVVAWGLRWKSGSETAYPSTFILDNSGVVRFAHVSKSHGDRISVDTVLTRLTELK